ncbi:MAG: type II secretion system F family protein [Kiritimatiellae bacterium]|nr:type II secretion system F family protein [Kiritimatiellia bacterium]MBP5510075.1 type II secretion system F family protein [Kiritimatiellia bacterium]
MSEQLLKAIGVYVLVFAAICAIVSAVVSILRSVDSSSWLGYLGPRWMAVMRERKRKLTFESHILDLTMGLANAMKAGMALPQALDKVSTQLGGVMQEEIATVLREYRLGMVITDAMDRLAQRMPCEDMNLLVSSIRLTMQTGGSLVDVLSSMVEMIRNRTEFQAKLKTLTAQGKFEAMAMASAPVAAFLLLFFIQPDLMRPLVTTVGGWIAIGIALTLETIGFVIIKKLITIEV